MGIKFTHANGAVATIVEGWDAWQVTIERVDGSDERFNEKRYALATDSLAQRGYKPATVADSDADAMANDVSAEEWLLVRKQLNQHIDELRQQIHDIKSQINWLEIELQEGEGS